MFDYEEIPDLEGELGPIIQKEQVCPGVYLLSARNDDEPIARNYYAVLKDSLISQSAKSYGHELSGLWLFPLTDNSENYKIIQYEVAKYRAQNKLPIGDWIMNFSDITP